MHIDWYLYREKMVDILWILFTPRLCVFSLNFSIFMEYILVLWKKLNCNFMIKKKKWVSKPPSLENHCFKQCSRFSVQHWSKSAKECKLCSNQHEGIRSWVCWVYWAKDKNENKVLHLFDFFCLFFNVNNNHGVASQYEGCGLEPFCVVVCMFSACLHVLLLLPKNTYVCAQF